MKTMKRPLKQQFVHYLLVCLALVFSSHTLTAQQVDIGIFKSETDPNQIEIRIRPDFPIETTDAITEIRYTVRWRTTDPGIDALSFVNPFNIDYSIQPPITEDGYIYQTFIQDNPIALLEDVASMEEVVISTFTYPGGAMYFEIINDQVTSNNNIDYYFELNGSDVTGDIYRAIVSIPLAAWSMFLLFIMMLAFVFYRFRKLI